MRLYHVSLRSNQPSIMREGVNPAYSQGARRESWYVTASKLPWAILHVLCRHRVQLSEVVAFEVLLRPEKVTRRWKGVYTCPEVVTPLFVTGAVEAIEVGASPTPGGNLRVYHPD